MLNLSTLNNFLSEYLGDATGKDDYANGLQVRGEENVEKIALGVSANLAMFQKSIKWGADVIICHHGLNFLDLNQRINNTLKNRLKTLFDNDVSLFGFHYLLDSHKKVGNNAAILKKLGAEIDEEFGEYKGNYWGWAGKLKAEQSLAQIKYQCKKIFGNIVVVYPFGMKEVKSVAAVSGHGGDSSTITEAAEKGVDALITGSVGESAQEVAREGKVNIIAVGHYNSEKLGVIELGTVLEKEFKVKTRFIDVPNKA